MENKSLSIDLSDNDSIDSIEDEIAKLSALIGAATYRLICLIGELDRRDGWADPLAGNGFRSCAHWLSWRIGLSLGTARQYVRVARVLPELARISAAFGAGELSYSKVRAITRVANPDNEEMVLSWARAGTASQVERLVREFRRADPARENDRAIVQQESRSLVTWFDSEGMLVVRGRLSPEQGALLVKALEVSADELTADARGSEEPSGATEAASASEPWLTGDQLKADALSRVAERSRPGTVRGAPFPAAHAAVATRITYGPGPKVGPPCSKILKVCVNGTTFSFTKAAIALRHCRAGSSGSCGPTDGRWSRPPLPGRWCQSQSQIPCPPSLPNGSHRIYASPRIRAAPPGTESPSTMSGRCCCSVSSDPKPRCLRIQHVGNYLTIHLARAPDDDSH
jgi:Domain of unknown function (DUF222)